MRLHPKPYSYENIIRSSDNKCYLYHNTHIRRFGSLMQLAQRGRDFDGHITYTFPLGTDLLEVLLSLIEKPPALVKALSQFSNYKIYTLVDNLKNIGVHSAWLNKILEVYFTRCTDEDCVAFWSIAKEFGYLDGEKKTFRRLLYTIVPHVLSDTVHKHFYDITVNEFVEILNDDKLNIKGSEWNVVEIIDKWIDADVTKRGDLRQRLYSLVRRKGLRPTNEIAIETPFEEAFNQQLPPRKPRDRLMYMGGWNIHSAPLRQYFYDQMDDRWSLAAFPKLPEKVCGYTIATVESTIYVIGGYDRNRPTSAVYSLEIREGLVLEWQQKACLNQRRYSHATCVLRDVIYTAGGFEHGTNQAQQSLRHFECYDLVRNQWRVLSQMHAARSDLAMVAGNGRIFVAGGRNENGIILNTVEMYQPDADIWIDVVAMPEPRKAATLLFDGHSLIVAGGFTDINNITNKVIRWSPDTFTWHDHSTLNIGRVKMAGIIYNNRMILAGGRVTAADLRGTSVVEVYDPIERRWDFDVRLRFPRQGGHMTVVPDSADLILMRSVTPRPSGHSAPNASSSSETDIEASSDYDNTLIETPRGRNDRESSQESTSSASTE